MTSALVVTLEDESHDLAAVLAALTSDARLTLGERVGVRLPVVAETLGLAAAEALTTDLLAVPGIVSVDVVLVDFDPDADVDGTPRFGRRRREEREESGHGPT